ncbi:YlbF family regulator [Streptococcaceae bacterium ESL0729]|nr:YlbF family regulator [Streptococcaceae bacterium ESL0729]
MKSKEDYEAGLKELKASLAELDYVRDFKELENKVKENPAIWQMEKEMKDLQKEAVLFKKIEKDKAYAETLKRATEIEEDLNHDLLIRQYRARLLDVSDLLDYISGELERKINEGLQSPSESEDKKDV